MGYRLPPLNALRAFEASARYLSFKKAAEELHVTPAAVSHQIKALEEYLGMPLFRRLTRALELTEEGRAMLPKLQEGFECLAAAVERTRHHKTGGVLTVSAPPSFAARWLMPRLQRFTGAHADIELRLSTSLATIDGRDGAPAESEQLDLRDAGSDVEIRFGSGRYGGRRTDRIFGVSYVAVCSPLLLKGMRPLRTPKDLRHHVLIHDDTIPDADQRLSWEEWLRAAGETGVDATRGPHFSNAGLAIEAAMDGLGVALALRPLAAADVAAGRLAILFDIAVPSPYAYWLVCPEATAERPAVAAFRDWLLAEAKSES
ncbi:MAG: LysR family transcriptional regulator [Rhodocyclaceae bacterium]|jgi:LysR family glycine cleavage system transcriptional activator|nr:LysR family transcriptional regulator [Rhodocyclaceae bacterium]